MRLVDLDAHFIDWIDPGKREGLDFKCPHCDERLRIFFANPFDGGKPRLAPGSLRWKVVRGSDLHDLTLVPSIRWTGHCHICVEDGQVKDAGP